MQQRLTELYHCFYKKPDYPSLKSSVEKNHKLLIGHLSKSDRKTILRIMDALDLICIMQTKDSFIQGFKLGFELTTELQNYDPQIYEMDSQKSGGFFMPNGGAEDEKEN